jgi:hypothetical protein
MVVYEHPGRTAPGRTYLLVTDSSQEGQHVVLAGRCNDKGKLNHGHMRGAILRMEASGGATIEDKWPTLNRAGSTPFAKKVSV